jgi:hypothetical protein
MRTWKVGCWGARNVPGARLCRWYPPHLALGQRERMGGRGWGQAGANRVPDRPFGTFDQLVQRLLLCRIISQKQLGGGEEGIRTLDTALDRITV